MNTEDPYWSRPADELIARLGSRRTGLTQDEAAARLARDGANVVREESSISAARILLRQFRSPLVLILLVAALIAWLLGAWTDALLVAVIVLASTAIGFTQEHHASRAIEALRRRLSITCRVLRDGQAQEQRTSGIVAGDVVELAAGSLVPADGVLLAARDCFVIQAVLTGESVAVEKLTAPSRAEALLAERSNTVFMGTSVRSGTATMLVVRTGAATAFGHIAARLKLERPETDFERGIRRFSALLTEFVLVLTVVVMAINLLLDRPALESLMFAVALAVGITPELLPAIVSYTLSRGARDLATQGVLVRRLASIENLGSMTVLCADKTGTLTVGAAKLAAAVDAQDQPSSRVLELALLNARLQTGLPNPLDEVLIASGAGRAEGGWSKVDEHPYDFLRRRMSVTVAQPGSGLFLTITKGALGSMLPICAGLRAGDGTLPLGETERHELLGRLERHAAAGLRVLGVATRTSHEPVAVEKEMVFEGLLLFDDPTKPGIEATLEDLRELGVRLKIITGDNRYTAAHVAQAVGMATPQLVTGEELHAMRDEALWQRVETADVFAEVDPNQKERIVLALRRSGAVVGYIGDGINDAPALHAADVGISVDGAVDVAREAADLVLLEHDLRVVNRGIRQGRITFANTQKYILATTSANFGNMLSMAAASAFLPFLPLTAPQILLNNLLTDVPGMALAGDRVDPEHVRTPTRWDMRAIRRFTIGFGLLSSVFDILTFAALFWLTAGMASSFRSGWFLESLATEVLVLLVIRTRRPLLSSSPSPMLVVLTVLVLVAALVFVQVPAGRMLSFVALPPWVLLIVAGISLAYVATVEIAKRRLPGIATTPGR